MLAYACSGCLARTPERCSGRRPASHVAPGGIKCCPLCTHSPGLTGPPPAAVPAVPAFRDRAEGRCPSTRYRYYTTLRSALLARSRGGRQAGGLLHVGCWAAESAPGSRHCSRLRARLGMAACGAPNFAAAALPFESITLALAAVSRLRKRPAASATAFKQQLRAQQPQPQAPRIRAMRQTPQRLDFDADCTGIPVRRG
jgi:hypothetical protein